MARKRVVAKMDPRRSKSRVSAIFTTTAKMEDAKAICHTLLARGLIACGTILPAVTSIYKWKGAVEEATEYLVMLKTRSTLVERVMKELKKLHSYDVPEMVAFDASAVFKPYAAWVEEVAAARGPSGKT
ncbi:MAG: divalent-cation tolerance protein CutA [Candidatus Bathyarchaeia archaeon]